MLDSLDLKKDFLTTVTCLQGKPRELLFRMVPGPAQPGCNPVTSEAPSLLLVSAGCKNRSASHREEKVNLMAFRSPLPPHYCLYDDQGERTEGQCWICPQACFQQAVSKGTECPENQCSPLLPPVKSTTPLALTSNPIASNCSSTDTSMADTLHGPHTIQICSPERMRRKKILSKEEPTR